MGKKFLAVSVALLAMTFSAFALGGCAHKHNYVDGVCTDCGGFQHVNNGVGNQGEGDNKADENHKHDYMLIENIKCECGALNNAVTSDVNGILNVQTQNNYTVNKIALTGANQIMRDNYKVVANMYLPNSPQAKKPTLIMSHGMMNGSSRFDTLAKLIASKLGMAVCTYNFCGGSSENAKDGSEGDTTKMSVITETQDLNAVMDKVKTFEYVDTNNLFLFGQSQGGWVSTFVADKRKAEVKGLCMYFPALSIQDDAVSRVEKNWGGFDKIPDTFPRNNNDKTLLGKCYYIDSHNAEDIFEAAKRFDKDVLICHGTKDTTVNIKYSQKAVDPATGFPNAVLQTIEGAGHGFRNNEVNTTNAFVLDYLVRHISK